MGDEPVEIPPGVASVFLTGAFRALPRHRAVDALNASSRRLLARSRA